MAAVTALLTTVDIDDRDARGTSLRALHEAVLDDGRRLALLSDRGWTGRNAPGDSREELMRTAKVVVGPDEPVGDQSRAEAELRHYETLADTLRKHGVAATAELLRELPHHVKLSDRLAARSGARS